MHLDTVINKLILRHPHSNDILVIDNGTHALRAGYAAHYPQISFPNHFYKSKMVCYLQKLPQTTFKTMFEGDVVINVENLEITIDFVLNYLVFQYSGPNSLSRSCFVSARGSEPDEYCHKKYSEGLSEDMSDQSRNQMAHLSSDFVKSPKKNKIPTDSHKKNKLDNMPTESAKSSKKNKLDNLLSDPVKSQKKKNMPTVSHKKNKMPVESHKNKKTRIPDVSSLGDKSGSKKRDSTLNFQRNENQSKTNFSFNTSKKPLNPKLPFKYKETSKTSQSDKTRSLQELLGPKSTTKAVNLSNNSVEKESNLLSKIDIINQKIQSLHKMSQKKQSLKGDSNISASVSKKSNKKTKKKSAFGLRSLSDSSTSNNDTGSSPIEGCFKNTKKSLQNTKENPHSNRSSKKKINRNKLSDLEDKSGHCNATRVNRKIIDSSESHSDSSSIETPRFEVEKIHETSDHVLSFGRNTGYLTSDSYVEGNLPFNGSQNIHGTFFISKNEKKGVYNLAPLKDGAFCDDEPLKKETGLYNSAPMNDGENCDNTLSKKNGGYNLVSSKDGAFCDNTLSKKKSGYNLVSFKNGMFCDNTLLKKKMQAHDSVSLDESNLNNTLLKKEMEAHNLVSLNESNFNTVSKKETKSHNSISISDESNFSTLLGFETLNRTHTSSNNKTLDTQNKSNSSFPPNNQKREFNNTDLPDTINIETLTEATFIKQKLTQNQIKEYKSRVPKHLILTDCLFSPKAFQIQKMSMLFDVYQFEKIQFGLDCVYAYLFNVPFGLRAQKRFVLDFHEVQFVNDNYDNKINCCFEVNDFTFQRLKVSQSLYSKGSKMSGNEFETNIMDSGHSENIHQCETNIMDSGHSENTMEQNENTDHSETLKMDSGHSEPSGHNENINKSKMVRSNILTGLLEPKTHFGHFKDKSFLTNHIPLFVPIVYSEIDLIISIGHTSTLIVGIHSETIVLKTKLPFAHKQAKETLKNLLSIKNIQLTNDELNETLLMLRIPTNYNDEIQHLIQNSTISSIQTHNIVPVEKFEDFYEYIDFTKDNLKILKDFFKDKILSETFHQSAIQANTDAFLDKKWFLSEKPSGSEHEKKRLLTSLLKGSADGDSEDMNVDLKGDLDGDLEGMNTDIKGDLEGMNIDIKGDSEGTNIDMKGDLDSMNIDMKGDSVGDLEDMASQVQNRTTPVLENKNGPSNDSAIQNNKPENTAHNIEPENTIHNNESESTIHNIQNGEPENTVHNIEPENTIHNNEPEAINSDREIDLESMTFKQKCDFFKNTKNIPLTDQQLKEKRKIHILIKMGIARYKFKIQKIMQKIRQNIDNHIETHEFLSNKTLYIQKIKTCYIEVKNELLNREKTRKNTTMWYTKEFKIKNEFNNDNQVQQDDQDTLIEILLANDTTFERILQRKLYKYYNFLKDKDNEFLKTNNTVSRWQGLFAEPELLRIGEAFFDPSILYMKQRGILEILDGLRNYRIKNVLITGGFGVLIKNLKERLEHEINSRSLFGPTNVLVANSGVYDPFRGAQFTKAFPIYTIEDYRRLGAAGLIQ